MFTWRETIGFFLIGVCMQIWGCFLWVLERTIGERRSQLVVLWVLDKFGVEADDSGCDEWDGDWEDL